MPDRPTSKDEIVGKDNGPCGDFRAEAPPWEHRCVWCGYLKGSHR